MKEPDLPGGEADLDGFLAGGVAGVEFWLKLHDAILLEGIAFNVGLSLDFLSFEPDEPEEEERETGTGVGLRAGVKLRF